MSRLSVSELKELKCGPAGSYCCPNQVSINTIEVKYFSNHKELNIRHKSFFVNPYIFATWWRKSMVFQSLNIWPNIIHSLKYQRCDHFRLQRCDHFRLQRCDHFRLQRCDHFRLQRGKDCRKLLFVTNVQLLWRK